MESNERIEQFDIEDIIREFSQKDADTDALLRQMFPETPAVHLQKQPVSTDTVRLDPIPQPEAPPAEPEAVNFAPVEPEAPPAEQPQIEKVPEPTPEMPSLEAETEPFSADWEPEYDAPMGEFEPKAPIPFPQKNRTRLLREKLVAGPEKRYQDLSATGLTGLNWGIFFQLLLTVLCISTTLLANAGKIPQAQLHNLLFWQLMAILLSGLLGCYRLLGGMGSLLRGQFTLNTLLCVSFALCLLDAYACLQDQQQNLSGLFCLQMLMAQLSARQQRVTEMVQMDTLRKAVDLTAIIRTDDLYEKRPGYHARPGEPEDFMGHYAATAAPERALGRYGLIVLAVSVALGLFAGFQTGIEMGIRVCAAALLIAVPATAHISMSRPMAIVHKRLHSLGAVLCGWHGIRYAEKNAVYPVTGEDLFPEDSIKMNGVKFYGSVDPGWVTTSAVALAAANESSIRRVLEQLPRGRDGLNQLVEDLAVYDGGLCGLVSGVPTVMGTAEFMQQMQIDLPQGSQIPHAVYLAVDGELSGVFAVEYRCDKSSAAGLRNLCSWRSLTPVLVSNDFMLTPRFIQERLGVKPRHLVFPPRELRQSLRQTEPDLQAPVLALTVKPGLAAKTFALNGAWGLRSSMSSGANIHMLGGAMGLLLAVLLTLLQAFEILSPENLLLYTLAWMIPGWLVTESARYS